MKATGVLVSARFWIALAVVLVASCGSESRDEVFGKPIPDGGAPSEEGGGTFPTTDASTCTEVHCSDDLHSVLDCDNAIVKTCPDTQGCGPGGSCVPACEAAMASKSTIGCEYYALPTAFGCYAVAIANTWTIPLTIAAEGNGVSINLEASARIPSGAGQSMTYTPLPNGQIPPQQVALLFLSSGSGSACPPGIRPAYKGPFHITTSAPVVAYDIDPYGGGTSAVTSASLLIPTSAWDTNYVAIAPWPFGPNSQPPKLTIVAAQDATDVTISPSVDIAAGVVDGQSVPGTGKGVPRTYTLQKGQTLSFEQQAELTGTPIQSTKPIGVMASSACINIDACCCDAAHQQIPPVQALGHEYVAVRYRNRIDGKEESPPWRIVGAVDGTTLTYEPSTPTGAPTTLSAGQFAMFRASGPFVVRSQDAAHPIYLAGYMTSGADFADRGDPEFVNVIPSAEYLGRYVFFTDPTYPETNLVLVRSRGDDGSFKDVNLDCAGVLGGWQPIGASKYEYTRIDLVRHNFEKQGSCDNGRHEIASEAPFGLTVWGWGSKDTTPFNSWYVSYAYPGGASLRPVNQVVIPPSPK